jgi:hypothetical protein
MPGEKNNNNNKKETKIAVNFCLNQIFPPHNIINNAMMPIYMIIDFQSFHRAHFALE